MLPCVPCCPLMDGLQSVLCPCTSLFTFTMPMCVHGGTIWTSHTRPDVGWLGLMALGQDDHVPLPQQQRWSPWTGCFHLWAQGRGSVPTSQCKSGATPPACTSKLTHLHGRAAAMVQRAWHPVQVRGLCHW